MRITLDDKEITQHKKHRPPKDIKQPKTPKPPLTTKRKITKAILLILAVITVAVISYIGYFVYKAYKTGTAIGFKFRPNDIIAQDNPELKKDSTGKYTNILVVGVDTRENGNLLNTDSLILISYNYDTQDITMTSIPRDLHVQIKPDIYWFSRINAVYSTFEQNNDGQGMPRLCEVITKVTGQEIQYNAMIDYKGFVELIDAIGGIDVNVENSFTDYMYPSGFGYKTVRFSEGVQHMDGSTALEYARSRHSMHNGEGSDFARAKRQQIVISSITEKVTSGSLLDPRALMNLFNVVQDNIQISEFTLDDIGVGVDLLSEFKETGNSYSFILDPSAGAGRLLTSQNVINTGAYAIGPVDGLGQYDDIHEYMTLLLTDPQLYNENPVIKIYNTGLGYNETMQRYNDLVEQFPYLKIGYMGTLYNDKDGVTIYINNDKDFAHSLESINRYLKPDNTTKPEYLTTTLNAEDITILFGKTVGEVLEEDTTQTTP
ncbi:LCP family protein [bacterium]|nr:LCP family protein [bacterium]